jgi:hypothetical protein
MRAAQLRDEGGATSPEESSSNPSHHGLLSFFAPGELLQGVELQPDGTIADQLEADEGFSGIVAYSTSLVEIIGGHFGSGDFYCADYELGGTHLAIVKEATGRLHGILSEKQLDSAKLLDRLVVERAAGL